MIEASALFAIAAIIAAAFFISANDRYPGWLALVPTVAAGVLLVVGPRATVARALLSNPAAVAIGLISYPLYLWHLPLLSFARIMEEGPVARSVRVALVCLSFVLAWLTHKMVEAPVRQLLPTAATPLNRWRFVAGSALVVGIAAALGWTTCDASGFAQRYPQLEQVSADTSRAGYFAQRGSFTPCAGRYASGNALQWCETTGPGEPVFALLGDSHADHLFPGIAGGTADNWLLLAEPACPPLLDVDVSGPGSRASCGTKNRAALQVISRSATIKTVVLAFQGPSYLHDLHRTPHGGNALVLKPPASMPPAASSSDLFEHGLLAEIRALANQDRGVVLFIDVPSLDFMPTECVETRPLRLTRRQLRSQCAVDRSEVTAAQADFRSLVFHLAGAEPRLRIFDSLSVFCDDRWCRAMADGRPMYRDRGHLNVVGSRKVAGQFLPWLES